MPKSSTAERKKSELRKVTHNLILTGVNDVNKLTVQIQIYKERFLCRLVLMA